MGDLTKNLSRHEFTCRCGCGFDTVDIELPAKLQDVSDHFAKMSERDVRIDITGPNRCQKYNDELRREYTESGGRYGANTAEHSQHIYGRAADFKLFYRDKNEQIEPRLIYEWLDKMYGDEISLGLYVNRVHADTRTQGGARWVV